MSRELVIKAIGGLLLFGAGVMSYEWGIPFGRFILLSVMILVGRELSST